MGAGGAADPASETRRQAAQGGRARGAERSMLCALDGQPVERAAEGPAAEEHGVGPLLALGMGRHHWSASTMRFTSQCASRRSTTHRLSRSTSIVPDVRPLRSAQSSPPIARGLAVTGNGSCRSKRSRVPGLAGMPRWRSWRAPASPPSATATRPCAAASRRVRWACGATRSRSGSAKVWRLQAVLRQRKRRTRSTRRTSRPTEGRSAGRRQ
jgi:hypothetical protein